jgi:protein involved in temperature-dependent protein secretion
LKNYEYQTYEEEESDEEEEKIIGNIIEKPKSGISLSQYEKIVEYLSNNKYKWIPLTEIRKIFNTNTKRINIHLHDNKSTNIGSKGLLWRQLNGTGTSIEYCLV